MVPLLGKALDFPGASTIGMVSPWMTNGDLNKHLEQHASSLPLVNRFNIVSVKVKMFRFVILKATFKLQDVRAGLSYCELFLVELAIQSVLIMWRTVHSKDIIHGDLNGVGDLIRSVPTKC